MKTFWRWFVSLFKGPKEYMRLRDYPIFSKLSSYDLYLLAARMHERRFVDSEKIFESQYPLEVIYFVRTGEIKIERLYGGKEEKILGQNEHLGILDMFHGEYRTSTATAINDVTLDAISKSDLLDFIAARPRCGLKIYDAICREFASLIFEIAGKK
nr:hypothetical protein [Candidatus Cloacimonadota bacterium]